MSVIKVKSACKVYCSGSESKVVLKDFQMNVNRGTIYSLMGSSGCGKTTLLSCIVGIMKLDSGSIQIFGGSVKGNNVRIGYMPQETALIGEFTISEMIWFYGTIFGLSSEKIEERLSFLSKLLELPSRNKMIRECSGGQQRRVSFALTLVHEPDLLILDEPTVGVDPLLRSKIWDFLVDITSTKQVTVLLSTHYIEEARQSTHIGLMRNGVQIAEDSPANILHIIGTTNLEEAFLLISEHQELDANFKLTKLSNFEVEVNSRRDKSIARSNKQTNGQIIFALLMKNLLQIARNIDVIIIATLIPLISNVLLNNAIGAKIHDLSLGVVNNEVSSSSECFNESLRTTNLSGFECHLNKVSCRFINDFDNEIAEMKFYDTAVEAFDDAKAGIINGFVEFSANFTEHLQLFNDDFSDAGTIKVHLDQSDFQKTSLLKRKLYEAFQNFTGNLLDDCGKLRKAGNLPITIDVLFGELNFNLKKSIVPGFLLASFFALGSYITSISIIEEKLSGIWNRSLVSGAQPFHFLVSHVIVGFLILAIQFIEHIVFTAFFLAGSETSQQSLMLLGLILVMTGTAGLLFGLLLSTIVQSSLQSFSVAQFFVYPAVLVSGVVWPFEAIPWLLQYVGKILPFHFSSRAFQRLLMKNSSPSESNVYMAFVVLSCWIVVELLLCVWFTRQKK